MAPLRDLHVRFVVGVSVQDNDDLTQRQEMGAALELQVQTLE